MRSRHIAMGGIACFSAMLALAGTASGAEVVSAVTCRGVSEPGTIASGVTGDFAPDASAVHAVVEVDRARPGSRVRGTWVAVDAIATPDYPISWAEQTVRGAGRVRAHFQISGPDAGWPPGRYRLDVSIDGKLLKRVPFTIAKSGGPQARAAAPAAPAPAKPAKARGSAPGLIGAWRCSHPTGVSSLEFLSSDRLSYEGEALRYTLRPGAIRVEEEDGPADYRYRLDGDRLDIVFPEGDRVSCARAAATRGRATAQAPEDGGAGGGARDNALLRGNFCSWSGSSGGGGGYGRSTRAAFDGQGSFSYGSEATFSSEAGFGGGSSGVERGSYRVEGNRVALRFADGSTGVATVFNRGAGGRISELKYQGTLFAPQLCE